MKKELQLFKRILPILAAIIFCCMSFTVQAQDKYRVYKTATPSSYTDYPTLYQAMDACELYIPYTVVAIANDNNAVCGNVEQDKNITLTSDGTLRTITMWDPMRHIRVAAGGQLIISDIILKGRGYQTDPGGGLYNNGGIDVDGFGVTGGKLTMTAGAVIQDCYTIGSGAGVRCNVGEFIMTGGVIKDNVAECAGGAVAIGNGAKFTMSGGEISGNRAYWLGGGVANADEDVEFIMDNGEISDNVAMVGGGFSSTATATINGGKIINNEAIFGGGAFTTDNVKMTDGIFSGNKAVVGGGIFGLTFELPIKIENGKIMNNSAVTTIPASVAALLTARGINPILTEVFSSEVFTSGALSFLSLLNPLPGDGGGIYLPTYSSYHCFLTMTGGEISGNHADNGYGGGIFTGNWPGINEPTATPGTHYTNISITAPAMIQNNTASFESQLPSNASAFNTGSFQGAWLNNNDINYDGAPAQQITARYLVYKPDAAGTKTGEFYWLADAVDACDNTSPYTIYATVNDNDVSNNDNDGTHAKTSTWNNDAPVTIPAGYEITLTSWGNPVNGFVIKQKSLVLHIRIEGELTLENIVLSGMGYDYTDHDNVFYNYYDCNGGINVYGRLTMEAGAIIEKCYSPTSNGSAVILHGSDTTFIMNGGEIRYNKSTEDGAGVYLGQDPNHTIFVMNGGEIHHNIARTGGGIALSENAIATLNGGEIHNNSTYGSIFIRGDVYERGGNFGGGVVLWHPETILNINDGVVIRDNTSGGGAGVMEINGSTINMTGGEIRNNVTSALPCLSLYDLLAREAKVTINDVLNYKETNNLDLVHLVAYFMDWTIPELYENLGEISDDSLNLCIIIMSDSPYLFMGHGAGVQTFMGNFNMSGGKISDNTATGYGGGMYQMISVLNMTGGEISDNTAALDGGGVYANYLVVDGLPYSGTINMDGGSIHNNTAGGDGGGIFTRDHNNYENIIEAYNNITIADKNFVYGNTAGGDPFTPPSIDWSIKGFDISLLTNHQINYRGSNTETETVCAGDSITLEAIVAEELGVTYTYQWYRNEQKVNGKTGVAYTITDPQDGDVVYCVVKSNAECSDSIKTNAITINVTAKPVAPYVSPSEFETCIKSGTITLGDLDVKYTDIQWYADVDCKSELPLNTTIDQDTNYYYFTQIVNGCESDPTQYTVIINPNMIVPPPALPDTIEFCQDLKGSLLLEEISSDPNLHWYTDNQGQNSVDPQIPIDNDVIFYVTQTVGECTSTTYTEVFIQFVNQFEKAPKIDTTLYFCTGALLSDLNIRINYPLALNWFTSTTLGATPLANNFVLASGTYYAQIVHDGNCLNGAFAEVKVMVGESQSTPKEMEVCEDITLSSIALTGNGIIKWFEDVDMEFPLSSGDKTVAGTTYYAAFTSSICSYLAYVVTAKTCDCDVELTSSTTKEICSGDNVNYTITTDELDVIVKWKRAGLSYQSSNYINETLTTTTTYTISLQKPGCFAVEQQVTVTVKPNIPVSAKLKLKKN